MKAERQQKERTSRVIQPSKGGGGHIVDNRPWFIVQTKFNDSIQRKKDSPLDMQQGIQFNNKGESVVQCFSAKKKTGEDLPVTEGDVLYCIELLDINKESSEFKSLGIYLVNEILAPAYYDQVYNAINKISDKKIAFQPSTRPDPKAYFNYSVVSHEDYYKITYSPGPSDVNDNTEGIWHSIATNAGGAFYHPLKKVIVIQSDKYSKRDLLHELGHFKQYTNIEGIPAELNASKSQLLEYNNVILNENLFDETVAPSGHLGSNKYMTFEGIYKRFKYNQATVSPEVGEIKVKDGLGGFEKQMADQIQLKLAEYPDAIKNQIKGQLLADCKDYFEKF